VHAQPLRAEDDLDLLDIPTVCRRARVSRSFLYEEIRAGRLIARKLGRLTRVRIEDYRRWVDSARAIESSSSSEEQRADQRR
jgi:excisionase family DNA binding protein